MVLADPAACIHRNRSNNQYAEVGTKARPTHDRDSISKHAQNMGRLPTWSARVPKIIGAGKIEVQHLDRL